MGTKYTVVKTAAVWDSGEVTLLWEWVKGERRHAQVLGFNASTVHQIM